jgi:membrane dipeptidase
VTGVEAAALHHQARVVDLHVDTLLDLAAGKRDLDGYANLGHVDLPRLRAGGVDVQVFAAFIHPREGGHGSQRADELLSAFGKTLASHHGEMAPVSRWAELEAALEAGKIAAVLSVENGGDAVEGVPERVDVLYERGVRMMSLTWNNANPAGDGVLEAKHGGLTPVGRELLARMQDLGMIVDVSHLSEATFWDVLEATRGPLVASHSDAFAVHRHARNLSDKQLRALGDRQGVVGINFYPTFLGGATLERIVAHVEHMVEVMGIDGVALGSDFDGITQVPEGLEDVSRLPNLTAALLDRGYAGGDVAKILGDNALRVLKEVWETRPAGSRPGLRE